MDFIFALGKFITIFISISVYYFLIYGTRWCKPEEVWSVPCNRRVAGSDLPQATVEKNSCILNKYSGDYTCTYNPVIRASVSGTFRTNDPQVLNPDPRPPVFKPD